MRRLLLLLALAGAALPLATPSLVAQQRVTRKWPLDPDGAVKIHDYRGRVRVSGWDRDTIAVSATMPAGHTLLGGGSRSAVKIAVEGPDLGNVGVVDLEVRVPAGAQVWVRGAATDIDVSGLIGTVDLATVSGDVLVRGAPRTITAESMNGTVNVSASCETLRAKTSAGPLLWEGSARDAQLSTVSGPVRVGAGPLERVTIESVTGDVTLESALRADTRLMIETHGGNVGLRFPARTPLRLDADAARMQVPGKPPRTREGSARFAPVLWDFNVVAGRAAPQVTVRSFTGALRLGFGP
ncbi:MAG: hypothetical protein KA761_04905 [Gemmatimonadaceae bacterium]|nr:hypothetical protein [Gemmatimonadaceae bacterium]